MKIAISSESSVDLDKVLLEKYDIHVLPYQILLGDRIETDGQISPEEIFDYAQKNKILPKTSALNSEEYKYFFEELLKSYDKVIHLSLSSGISSTFYNAQKAAEELENVTVIDSSSLSTGIGIKAIRLRELLESGVELKKAIESVKNMNFLGGAVSGVLAGLASCLFFAVLVYPTGFLYEAASQFTSVGRQLLLFAFCGLFGWTLSKWQKF